MLTMKTWMKVDGCGKAWKFCLSFLLKLSGTVPGWFILHAHKEFLNFSDQGRTKTWLFQSKKDCAYNQIIKATYRNEESTLIPHPHSL